MKYADYIQSPKWEAVKRRYRRSKLPQRCLVCGSVKFDLHHRSYKRLGHERLNDLVPLCRLHHDAVHGFHKESGDKSLWRSTKRYIRANSTLPRPKGKKKKPPRPKHREVAGLGRKLRFCARCCSDFPVDFMHGHLCEGCWKAGVS